MNKADKNNKIYHSFEEYLSEYHDDYLRDWDIEEDSIYPFDIDNEEIVECDINQELVKLVSK